MADRKFFTEPLNPATIAGEVEVPFDKWDPKVQEYFNRVVELSRLQAEILRGDYINNKPWVDRLNRKLSAAGQFKPSNWDKAMVHIFGDEEVHKAKSDEDPMMRTAIASYPEEILKDNKNRKDNYQFRANCDCDRCQTRKREIDNAKPHPADCTHCLHNREWKEKHGVEPPPWLNNMWFEQSKIKGVAYNFIERNIDDWIQKRTYTRPDFDNIQAEMLNQAREYAANFHSKPQSNRSGFGPGSRSGIGPGAGCSCGGSH